MADLITNWNDYYRKSFWVSKLTRIITLLKIKNLCLQYCPTAPIVCEIGGANSCVLNTLAQSLKVREYCVIDNNQVGVDLLPASVRNCAVYVQVKDILDPLDDNELQRADFVLSIGLIEHFSEDETKLAVERHFQLCKSGGLS